MADLNDGPRFPPELEREIFELVALKNLDTEARKLLFVAKRVHEWIEPLIYRVIFYFGMPRRKGPPPTRVLKEFCLTHQVTPRMAQICTYAHRVLLHGMTVDDVIKIIPLCYEAKEFVLWMLQPSQDHHLLQEVFPKSAATSLSIDVSRLFTNESFKFQPSALQNMTHLDVIGLSEDYWKVEWKNFRFLTKLSHLAIDPPKSIRDHIIGGIVGDKTGFKSLQILLVIVVETTLKEVASQQPTVYSDDPRVVPIRLSSFPIERWIKGARSGHDMWYTAERVKQGLIRSKDPDGKIPYY